MCRLSTEGSAAPARRLWLSALLVAALAAVAQPAAAAPQLGALVSPGALSKAHAAQKGAASCSNCHEAGRRVSAERCLSCHKPIAERIAKKTGVHRAVTDNCVTCHIDHAGADAEIRRIDTAAFDHSAETTFPLDGRHAAIAKNCAACHKERSFVAARAACGTCHTDVHKGTLGVNCATCHSTKVPFKEMRAHFDHAKARFVLTGSHREVACEKCHAGGVFRGLQFGSCNACHVEPHRRKLGPTCTACHTTAGWTTRTVEHAQTRFPLAGKHAQVPCASCHTAKITTPLHFEQCSACHVNVHRDSVKDDCRACHTEKTFKGASPFDHGSRTTFALVGKHDGLACAKCHTTRTPDTVPLAQKVIDFAGVVPDCVSCHEDKHKGEYGRTCDNCHRPAGFKVDAFKHPRAPDFYDGGHTAVACVKCHKPNDVLQPVRTALPIRAARARAPAMECVTCHKDVHLGQVGIACEQCHSIVTAGKVTSTGAKFAAPRFSHDRTTFALTGKHGEVACAKCHRTEVHAFPAGTGSAMRLRPMGTECRTCHEDPHMGQVDARCETCHSTATFKMQKYTHFGLAEFFNGFHGKLACQACHKKVTGVFPSGVGTALRFKVGKTCRDCHREF
jgi:hypothetical protein